MRAKRTVSHGCIFSFLMVSLTGLLLAYPRLPGGQFALAINPQCSDGSLPPCPKPPPKPRHSSRPSKATSTSAAAARITPAPAKPPQTTPKAGTAQQQHPSEQLSLPPANVDNATFIEALNKAAVDGLIEKAKGLNAKGDFDGAVRAATEAVTLDSKNAVAYFNRGSAYLGGGYYAKAVIDFTAVVILDPGNVGAYYGRATAYEKLGLTALAAADKQKAFELIQRPR